MVDGLMVTLPGTVAAVDADTFLEVGSKLLERFEKQPVFLAETEIGILDLLDCNIRLPVADILIMIADPGAEIVQMAVDAVGFETAVLSAAAADLPKRFRNGELRAELGDTAVRDAPHDRDDFLRFVFVSFKVEQNLERAAHKLCFLRLQK